MSRARATRAPARARILIADDHALMRNGVANLLNQESDLEVVAEAPDGQSAVELYDRHRPDVALIDLRMPGMDGLDVAREIRRRERAGGPGRPLTLIALTANAFAEDRERALEAGFDDFMPKPLDPDRLRRMLGMGPMEQARAPQPAGIRTAAGA